MDDKSNDDNQTDASAPTVSTVSSDKAPVNAASGGSQGGATTSGALSDNKASWLENEDRAVTGTKPTTLSISRY